MTPNDDKAYTIGGLYDLKAVVVGALFERAKSKTLTGGDVARNYFRFSAMMPVGKHEFHVNFGTTNVRLDADLDDDGAKQWTLGYNYNITKETKVYGFYTRVDNDIVACHRRAPQLLKGATSSANFLPSQAAGYDISFKTEPREIP